jgi:hypothetical protein
MFFSAKVLRKNPLRLEEKLLRDLYKFPALPQSNNRIIPVNPEPPVETHISVGSGSINLSWEKGKNTKKFVIYKLRKEKPADLNNPENIFQITSETSLSFSINSKTDPDKYYFVITSQSQTNTESEPEYFTFQKQ